MKMHTVTGGGLDHFALIPETIDEAAALVFAARSKFMPAGSTELLVRPELAPYLKLLIFAAKPAPPEPLSAEMREAIDSTP